MTVELVQRSETSWVTPDDQFHVTMPNDQYGDAKLRYYEVEYYREPNGPFRERFPSLEEAQAFIDRQYAREASMTYDKGYDEGYEDAIKDVTADAGESPIGNPSTSAEILALAADKEIWSGDLDEATDLWTAVAQEFPDAEWYSREYSGQVFVKDVTIPLNKADAYRLAAEGGVVDELFQVAYAVDATGESQTTFAID